MSTTVGTAPRVDQAAVRAAAEQLPKRDGRTLVLRVHPDRDGLALVLAAAEQGGRISLLHPGWTEPETERVLERLGPCRIVDPTGGHDGVDGTERGPAAPEALAGPSRTEWILWSSGTSGAPRGVVLSDRALAASSRAVAARLGLTADDRWLCTLWPAHVGGLALVLRARDLGSALHAPGPFDAERVARAIAEHGITHLSLVPVQLRRLLDARGRAPAPGSLRTVLLGGAATPPELLERAIRLGYPVSLTWGMTETASQIATASPTRVRENPGTVGPPLDGIEVREVDGELLVRGPTLATGRWAGAARPPEPLADADGWYHTGDRGQIDSDGSIRIAGRTTDRIITGGVNVEPTEVEAALLRHPAVREVAVVGVPDPEWGERVVAVVVASDESLELDNLRSFLEPILAAPKRPRELRVVPALPRNANGKVNRRALRDRPA